MVRRPYFIPLANAVGVLTATSEPFPWAPGFALVQKRKNIAALHDAIRRAMPGAVPLEISSKSENPLGVQLSAFNLTLERNGMSCSVESVFQASKVFEGGIGPFPELYGGDSREVRKFVQEKSAGHRLVAFELDRKRWPLEPKTEFYDRLYIHALQQHHDLCRKLREGGYSAFTDIEFNPERQVNCQAASVALYLSRQNPRFDLAYQDSLEKTPEEKEAPKTPEAVSDGKQPHDYVKFGYQFGSTQLEMVEGLLAGPENEAWEFFRFGRPYWTWLSNYIQWKFPYFQERKSSIDGIVNATFARLADVCAGGKLVLDHVGKGGFRGFLKRIACNVAIDHMRMESSTLRGQTDSLDETLEYEDGDAAENTVMGRASLHAEEIQRRDEDDAYLKWLKAQTLFLALGYVLNDRKATARRREMLRLRYELRLEPREMLAMAPFKDMGRNYFDVEMNAAKKCLQKKVRELWSLVAPVPGASPETVLRQEWEELTRNEQEKGRTARLRKLAQDFAGEFGGID